MPRRISVVIAVLQNIWCACLHAVSGNIFRASFLSSVLATKVLPCIPCGAVVLRISSVTGNLSATLERGRWLSVSSGRLYINEGMSALAHRKIRPATATALRTAAEALPCKNAFENTVSDRHMHLEMR